MLFGHFSINLFTPQDNLGKASNEDWFMQTLIKAVCEYVLFGSDVRGIPHFNKDRMNKYAELINEFGESKPVRESNCLFGIQQMIRQLEHPQGEYILFNSF